MDIESEMERKWLKNADKPIPTMTVSATKLRSKQNIIQKANTTTQ